MRDRATLDFIRDRVIAYVRAHPPTGALLTERAERAPAERCGRGHDDWGTRSSGVRYCRACSALRKRDRRAMGVLR